MRITDTHVAFWQSRRRPSWAPKLPELPSVHHCINEHFAGRKYSERAVNVSNLIALVKKARRSGYATLRLAETKDGGLLCASVFTDRDYLKHLATNGTYDALRWNDRHIIAKRWYRRLLQSEGRLEELVEERFT